MKKTHLLNWIECKFKTKFFRVTLHVITIITTIFALKNKTKIPMFLVYFSGFSVLLIIIFNKYKITKYLFILSHILCAFITSLYIFFILKPTHQ